MNDSEQLDVLIGKAKEVGALTERLRIIKLLEEEVRYDFPSVIEMSLDSLKELIKGEQK